MSDQPKQVFDRTQGPTEVRAAVQAEVAGNDYDPWEAIEEAEGPLAVGRMRLMGVYDDRQRNRFMLRIRIPGGQINADQLDTVAGVIRDFGNGWQGHTEPDRFGEITTRQDIQVHWVEFTQLPEIWRRFDAVGMTTAQACGDSMRNPTACPADGADPRGYLPWTPHRGVPAPSRRNEEKLTAFLPRKWKVVVTGCPTDCAVVKLHCLAFTPARGADGTTRVQRARGRRAERLAPDRRRVRPVRAARPSHRHRPRHAADLPGVRRLRHEGRQPVPGARAPARTRQGDRADPLARRERDDRSGRVVVDRRAGGPPRCAPATRAARTSSGSASRWGA